MYRWLILTAVVCLLPLPASAQSTGPSGAKAPEMIEIDGRKHPEQIPQWSAWESALRTINTGSKLLPSKVHHLATEEERALISKEAAANAQRDTECRARIEREIGPLVGKEKRDTLRAKQQAIHIDCRWKTLHARDHLLAQLRPEVGEALIEFVEHTKASMVITMPKAELDMYRQPE